MAAPEPLEDMIDRLSSLDADQRFQALTDIRRYIGTRKVDQAVFEMRNDGDRRVRTLARELLAEADTRNSSSLAVQGAQENEKALLLEDLLKMAKASDPTDRVSALKQLRMMDHPSAIAAVEAMKKDPNRVVRMVAESAIEDRITSNSRSSTSARFENGVMVATPAAGAAETPGAASQKMSGEALQFIGLGYLLAGVPATAISAWLWLWMQGYLPDSGSTASDIPGLDSSPVRSTTAIESDLQAGFEHFSGMALDPLKLAVFIVLGGWAVVTGVLILQRKELGRKSAVSMHAVFAIAGMMLPNIFGRIIWAVANIALCGFYTRAGVVAAFDPDPKDSDPPPSANYGTMERKNW